MKFMNNLKVLASLAVLVYLNPIQSLSASELMSPATQLGAKKFHAELYYRALVSQDLTISQNAGGAFNIKNATINSVASADLASEGSGNGIFSKLTFQPFDDNLLYYVIAGVSTYNLKIPSGSYSNSFATDDPGIVAGGGIKYTLVPYTMVTPAVSLDLSATHSRYRLSKFSSGDGKTVGDTGFLFTIFEVQGSVTMSKKMIFDLGDNKASFDPYLGVKVIRTRTGLDDLSSGAHYSGTSMGVAPYVGFKFKPFPYEGIVFEGSFINDFSFSAGLTLGF